MKTAFLLLLFFGISFSCFAGGMRGSYTIDPSGSGATNFISFEDAIQQLEDSGIASAVVFSVADGNYYGNLILDSTIKGVSATNTITFQSASFDSSKVVLQSSNAIYTIYLLGSKYVNFKWMTIASYSYSAIFIGNHSSYNKIENCIIRYYIDGIYIVSSWVSNTKFNVITNNHIVGLRKGAGIEVKSGNFFVSDLTIANNIIDSCGNSIYVWKAEHMSIAANLLYGPVEIDLTYSTGTKDASILNNNFIWVDDTNQNYSALYLQEFEGVNVFNNSVYTKDGNAFWSFKVLDNSQVKNNIFYNAGQGTAIEADDATLINYDHNDLYSNGKVLCINGSNICANLAAWEKKTKMDAHSVSVFPFFKDTSSGDLHLTYLSSQSLDSGIYIASDSLDRDGEKRNKKHVWLGADELLPDTADAGVSNILSPKNHDCASNNTSVTLKVHNYGLKKISGFNVYARVHGAVSGFDSIFFKDTLSTGADTIVTINFLPGLNTDSGGLINVAAWTALNKDQDHSNDTFYSSAMINKIPNAKFSSPYNLWPPYIAYFKAQDTTYSRYIWDFGDGSPTDSGYKVNHAYKTLGWVFQKLSVTDSNGCQNSETDSTYVIEVGIEKETDNFNFSIYPNPFQNIANINYFMPSSEEVMMKVYDLTGRRIALLSDGKQESGSHTLKFIPGDYGITSGVYLLKTRIGDKQVVKELIMQK